MRVFIAMLFVLSLSSCAGKGPVAAPAQTQTNPPAASPQASRAGWYQWRGPEQNGVCRETNLPEHWSPDGDNLLWVNNIGGQSCPIVMNGKFYTLTRVGEVPAPDTIIAGTQTREAFTCCDAATGKVIWQHLEPMTQTDVPFWRIGWANPVGDPKTGNVYAMGAQCTLLCLDGNDGHVIWKHQMSEEYGLISTFGGRTPSAALDPDDDQLYIAGVSFGWADHARGQHRMFCFDKNNGQLRWSNSTPGVPTDAPQNTPVITVINGEKLVMLGAGDGTVDAFQTRTGKKVWSYVASKRGLNTCLVVEGAHIFYTHSEDNLDTNVMGAVGCLDAGDVTNGHPKLLWHHDGIEDGFSSPVYHDGILYAEDNKAIVWALDADTGKTLWKKPCGTIGKAALVWADNKLYVAEANGRFWILKLNGREKPEVLSKNELPEKLGREYAIFGSVAISDGHIFLQCANKTYCIGEKNHKTTSDQIPAMPKESAAGAAAFVQVLPTDVVLHPGEKQQFQVKLFDALGHPAADDASAKSAKWEVGQLAIAVPPSTQPTTSPAAPIKIGNLAGAVDPQGDYTAAAGPFQAGAIIASTADGLSGFARVRVLPPLPWKFDFSKAPVGKPPMTWTGAGGKFAVRDLDGEKVLAKLTDIPLFWRARTNFGTPDMSNYTIQADVRVAGKIFTPGITDSPAPPAGSSAGSFPAPTTQTSANGPVTQMPDIGIIDSRYVLVLMGMDQQLQIHIWPPALPLSVNKTIPYAWKPDTWYRLKLMVQQKDGKAIVKGKIWEPAQPEPADWTIDLVDTDPNTSGSPGLFSFSYGNLEGYYKNISVTGN